jgi:2-C-methyl-D-erythritol 4-phosphate cytidylyltransferase/2-C-methyl-D-erythritol 2,4-cyclodiphosphate synthase
MTGQDDLSVAEAHGIGVLLVPGEERNLKITHSGDLTLAGDLITAGRQPRVGLGFDVHPLREGHGVRLGGVLIRCPYELEGHSDADVIAHAAMDALLGATGGGDIGLMFPPGDERWRNADSIKLLESVWQRLASQGYLAGNVDITVLAETPRLSPHFHDMQRCLAGAIQCEPWRVNVKATTTEKLGSIGRAEGIAAMAVAMLYGPGGQSATTTPAS